MEEGKERVSACLKKKAKLEEKREELAMTQDLATATTSTDEASGLPELSASTVHRQQVSSSQLKRVEDEINALDQSSVSGMQFVIDNFDLRQNVREMTCESQNKDYHWINHNCVLNRVSGAHLDNTKPVCDINDLPYGTLLPQARDHLNNRENYIVLVQRVLVECIPALGFLKDAVKKHIPHEYSKEMGQKTTKVQHHTIVK